MAIHNTHLRVLSALGLISLVAFSFYLGPYAFLFLSLICCLLIIDEVWSNIFVREVKSRDQKYWMIQVVVVLNFVFWVFFDYLLLPLRLAIIQWPGVLFNSLLIVTLFLPTKTKERLFKGVTRNTQLIVPLYFGVLFLSTIRLIAWPEWQYMVALLGILSFGSDIAAWFVGRKWGKRPLWHSISPNKTIEGLLGAILVSTLLAILFTLLCPLKWSGLFLVYFPLLSLISQLGDLVQSSFKRFANIKDSSTLIPGHGGVYDRLDGIIFLTPFYVVLLTPYLQL